MGKPVLEVEVREMGTLEAYLHDKAQTAVHYQELARQATEDAALVPGLLAALQEISQVAMANGDEFGVALIADVAIAKAMPISTAISSYKLNDGTIGGIAHGQSEKSVASVLPADTSRLNWLETNPTAMIRHLPTWSRELRFQIDASDGDLLGFGVDLRSAIDAAIRNSSDEASNA